MSSVYTARVVGVSTGTSAKTVLQVIPASNTPIEIVEIGISFTSVTGTDPPVLVEIVRQSTSAFSSSLSIVSDWDADPKATMAAASQTFTSEPTLVDIIRSWEVTPVGGLFVVQFPPGARPKISTRRPGIRVTSSISQSASAYLTYAE